MQRVKLINRAFEKQAKDAGAGEPIPEQKANMALMNN